MNIQVCKSFSDAVPLYLPLNLFLKPVSKLNISVQLPSSKALGKTISNWELMERMREMIKPETFSSLKVVKTTAESSRFEGEIEDRKKLSSVVRNLDERSIKLNSYPESLKLKASEAKLDFPTRHVWDSFFRDTPNMDEMKPGERPDTIHISNLPIKWFVSHRDAQDEDAKPSETLFRKVFEKFGKVRCVDIPICDPYRKQMKPHMTGMNTFSFDQELYFEGYIQFTEYVGFVRAMDTFRGMKLLKKGDNGVDHAVHITVGFDKTKHLSEATIKRRAIVRERLMARERAKEEKEKEEALKQKKKEDNERRKQEQKEHENLAKMLEREERRKAKQLAKIKEKESTEMNLKIAVEKKKLLRTQRKLQSTRLIEELFRRIELKQKHSLLYDSDRPELLGRSKDTKKELKKIELALLSDRGRDNRDRLVSKYKSAQEQELEEQRLKLKKAVEGKLLLRSALDLDKKKARSPSISSVSSTSDIGDYDVKKVKTERLTTPERQAMAVKNEDPMGRGYRGMPYTYPPYTPYMNNFYHPPVHQGGYYPRPTYYPPPPEGGYPPRGRGYPNRRGRGGRGRGGPRMPYFEGPNANHAYYMYFKKLAENENTNEHDDRSRSYSRSRSRSRRRSYSRSRSSRSYTRSRSRSRRRSSSRHRRYSRSRSRRSRSSRSRSRSRSRHSRRSRSRSHKSRSRSHKSRSRSHKSRSRSRSKHRRSRSRSRHSRDSRSRNRSTDRTQSRKKSKSDKDEKRSKSKSKERKNTTESPKETSSKHNESKETESTPPRVLRDRSKSWSLPREEEKKRSWSKSPQRCAT